MRSFRLFVFIIFDKFFLLLVEIFQNKKASHFGENFFQKHSMPLHVRDKDLNHQIDQIDIKM